MAKLDHNPAPGGAPTRNLLHYNFFILLPNVVHSLLNNIHSFINSVPALAIAPARLMYYLLSMNLHHACIMRAVGLK
jgi:hypothetical protein